MNFFDFLNDIRRRAGLPLEEGMDDSSFMMSTVDANDDGLPPIYPLPTDATEYKHKLRDDLTGSTFSDEQADSEKLKLPDLEVGDELMVGKFKNRNATIKGFKTDKHNQPIAKTDKGDQQIFKGRVKKLMNQVNMKNDD
jgi:hypothetical protein